MFLKLKPNILQSIGIPQQRAEAWRLILDYIPVDSELHTDTLERKREEYSVLAQHYFGTTNITDTVDQLAERVESMFTTYEIKQFKQIKIDVHRTQPEVKLFGC